jgi:hypothetical protein
MNWKKIVLYVLFLFLATMVAAFPFGFMIGFWQSSGEAIPAWIPYGPMICVPLAAILVFARLAAVQYEKTYSHAGWVCVISWALSFLLNVILINQSVSEWFLGATVLAITAVMGVFIGKYFQKSPHSDEPGQSGESPTATG